MIVKDYVSHVLDRIAIGDECWEWLGSHDSHGYGQVMIDGRHRMAHRVIYRTVHGGFDERLSLDHLCGNKGCVKPSHLEPVTHRENVRRALVKDVCLRGHDRTAPGSVTKNGTCTECTRKYSREWMRAKYGHKPRKGRDD